MPRPQRTAWRGLGAGSPRRARLVLLATMLPALLPRPAQAAYFLVEEGTEKCFLEDLLEHQVMRMTYSMQDKHVLNSEEEPTDCKISVQFDAAVVKEHALVEDNHAGVLAHVAQKEGAYRVCLACHPKGWFNHRKLKWSIALDVHGLSTDVDLDKVVKMSHIQGTHTSVQTLIDRVGAVFSENEHEKKFEAKFVKASNRVNTDVTAFKLIQMLLISCMTVFQLAHMSEFLRRSCIGCLPFRQPKDDGAARAVL